MSEKRRLPNGQILDQAELAEEMRKRREARASEGADAEAPAGGLASMPEDAGDDDGDDDFDELPKSDPVKPPQLLSAPPAVPPKSSDTETLLNGLIEECRYLMREVAFNSARQSQTADDRVRFLSCAESLAITSARVADSITRLRGGAVAEGRHQRITVEHVQTVSTSPGGEGGAP